MKEVKGLEKIDFEKVASAVTPTHEERFKRFSLGFTKGIQAGATGFGIGTFLLTIIAGIAAVTVTTLATIITASVGALLIGAAGLAVAIYKIWKADQENLAAKKIIDELKKELQKSLIELADDFQNLENLIEKEKIKKLETDIAQLEKEEDELKKAKKLALEKELTHKKDRRKLIEDEQLKLMQTLRVLLSLVEGETEGDKLISLMQKWDFTEPSPDDLNIPQEKKQSVANGFSKILDKIKTSPKEFSPAEEAIQKNLNEQLRKNMSPELKSHIAIDVLTGIGIILGGASFSGGLILTAGILALGSVTALFTLGAVVTVPLLLLTIAGGVGAYLLYKYIENKQAATKSMLKDTNLQLNVTNQNLNDAEKDVEKLKVQLDLNKEQEKKEIVGQQLQKTTKVAYQNIQKNYDGVVAEINKLDFKQIREKNDLITIRFKMDKAMLLQEKPEEYARMKLELETINASLDEIIQSLELLSPEEHSEKIATAKSYRNQVSEALEGLDTSIKNLNEVQRIKARRTELEKMQTKGTDIKSLGDKMQKEFQPEGEKKREATQEEVQKEEIEEKKPTSPTHHK